MTFKCDNRTYSLLEIRKRFKTPAFRTEDGYRDERDFIQMKIGISYHACMKICRKISSVTRID